MLHTSAKVDLNGFYAVVRIGHHFGHLAYNAETLQIYKYIEMVNLNSIAYHSVAQHISADTQMKHTTRALITLGAWIRPSIDLS